ncbi:MAG: hypothetical protein HY820_09455 [Acidobacteria bacterium]|nr:hypothetical protein [Acidobacteriota bacterium]
MTGLFKLGRNTSKPAKRTTNIFGAIRSARYFRPLAILLPLLMLGPSPQFRKWSLIPSAPASICIGGQTEIMQTCEVPASFEANAIAAFLQAHSIPLSDIPLVRQYGRADLRNELRANLFANLLAIIKKDPATRTPEEQRVYNWTQDVVWQHQKEQYLAAILDRDAWKSNPCNWKPDSDIAKQYNLNYDGSLWCAAANNLSGLFSIAPPVPSKDYFLAAAMKKSYGQKMGSTAGGPAVLNGMLQFDMAAAAIAAAGGLSVVGGVGAGLLVTYFVVGATNFATFGGLSSMAAEGAFVLAGASGAGAAAIVLVMAAIGAIAAFQVYEQQKTLDQLNTLTTDYNWILANKPRLEGYVDNPVGLYKLRLSFAENTVPDFPSTALPPGRQSADRNFIITPMGGSPATSPTFTHLDWAGTRWTVQPSGGWISAQGVKQDNSPDYNFGVSFKFKGWDGNLYTAGRNDLHFIVSKLLHQDSDTPFCEPDSTGNSPGDVSKCAVYITNAVNLLDANGNKVTVRFTNFPLFTSPATFPADLTTTTQIGITASGDPLPAISLVSALPSGFSFNATGPGKAQITVSPQVAPATYDLTLRADNGASPATQTVKILANLPVQIQGPGDYSLYAGQPFSQLITIAGSPKPALTCTGNSYFQAWAVFTDNHNGTGTLSGTLGPVTRDVAGNPVGPVPVACTLTASNGLTTDTKLITIYGVLPPQAAITSATTVTWVDNDTNELRVTTSVPAGSLGVPKVSFSFPCPTGTTNAKPYWMTFKDNGNGTAVLSGRPPFGTTSVPLLLFVSTGEAPRCYSGIKAGPNGLENVPIPPNITINVRHVPVLPSPLYHFMTAGVPVVATNFGSPAGGDGTVSGTPPPGVQFTGGPMSTWHLNGTAPLGSGGEYDTLYTATAPTGSASGIFQLFVLEPPQIVSLQSATFRTGQDNSFSVSTTGFPKLAIPGLRDAMRITVQGMLPPGVVFTDTNPSGLRTGAAMFSGNPPLAARGAYPLTLTASNGVGSNAIQNFTLVVALPGDANNDGLVNCADLDLVGSAFGYYRGSAKYNPNADLNGDGVVNFADATNVESHLPAGTSCIFSMGFSAMSAALSVNGKSGNFDLAAAFSLNPVSTGIDPVTQPFSLQVGGFNETLPAGSFKLLQNGAKQGVWVYDGKIGGVSLSVQIQPFGVNAFQLKASAAGGPLAPLPNPVTVKIRIGDDSGVVSVYPSAK